jgi:hypothetical protein
MGYDKKGTPDPPSPFHTPIHKLSIHHKKLASSLNVLINYLLVLETLEAEVVTHLGMSVVV